VAMPETAAAKAIRRSVAGSAIPRFHQFFARQ
jgi:hypothetical protein